MPGSATVIGRVAVKVVPDTEDFRGQAQRELTSIEKALDGIKVSFEANVRQVETEVKDALTAGQREANRGAIDLSFSISGQEEVKRKVKQLKDDIDDLDGNVSVGVDHLSYRIAQARMVVLARTRFAEIVPKVNEAAAAKVGATLAALSGGRAFKNLATDFSEWLGGLDKAVPKIAATTLAVTNLGSGILSATSNALTLGGSLATIGGAGLALPGIMGGLAIGVTAFAVAIKDFNKYVPNFAIGAGRATTAGEAWKHLQDVMSKNFWKNAAAPVRELVHTLFPQFSDGMKSISTDLGNFTGKLSSSFTGVLNGELTSMFDDLGKSIRIMSGYSDNFASIIKQLGDVGAGNLPKLAHWFGEITKQFDEWLKGKGQKGLQGFVDTGVAALKDLGSILASTGSTLAGLARAAESAGGSTLAMVRDTMSSVADAVNSPRFQKSLSGVFEGAHDAIANIVDGAGQQFQDFIVSLSDLLHNVLPKAGTAAGKAFGAIFDALNQPAIIKAVEALFDNLNTVVDNLAPSLPGVGKALGSILRVVGKLAVNLSRALAPALDTLSPAIVTLADDLEPLIKQLGDLLVNAVGGASPVLLDLVDVLGTLAGALAAILEPVNGVLNAMGSLPGPVKTALSALASIGILTAGAAWLGTAVRGKIAGIGLAATEMASQATIGQGALNKVGTTAQGITSRMSAGRLAIGGVATAIGTMVSSADKGNGALSTLGGALSGAGTGFMVGGGIGAAVGGVAGGLIALIQNTRDSGKAFKIATPSAEDFATTLDDVTGAVTSATRALALKSLTESGAIKVTDQLGYSHREVVAAIVNGGSARKNLVSDLEAQAAAAKVSMDAFDETRLSASDAEIAQNDATTARYATIQAALKEIGAVDESVKAKRREIAATKDYTGLLKGLPPKVKTKIETDGLLPTTRAVANLARKYNLTPKAIKTLIKATGIDATVKQVRHLNDKLVHTGNLEVIPHIDIETTKPNAKIDKTKAKVKDLAKIKGVSEVAVTDHATKPIGDIQKLITVYKKVVAKATIAINDQATSKINAIRTNLSNLNGNTATVTVTHRDNYVSSRTGGRTTADPVGRVTTKDGGRTVTVAPKVDVDPAVLATQTLKLARKISTSLSAALQQKSNTISNTFAQLLKKAGKKGAAALRNQFGGRIANFEADRKEFDKLMNQLNAAKAKLENLRNELAAFRAGVVTSFMAAADPTAIGATTYDGIVRGMELAQEHAARFQKAIQKLVKLGLNKETLKQIVAAGPEAGLAAAEAIVNGGVDKINDLQKKIHDSAKDTAKVAGTAVFGDLVGAASHEVQNLVKALGPLQEKLRKEARNLVRALLDELHKELKKGDPKPKDGSKSSSGKKPPPRPGRATVPSTVDDTPNGAKVVNKTLIYNAAPNNSLDSEESLFDALGKARGGWL